MKSSWPVSILLIAVLAGCRSYPQRLTPVETTASYFTADFLDTSGFQHSFKANIEAYGHTLGGIFVIKKISDNNYRMALLNEFGGTLLGFELTDGELKLRHAIPPLRRNALLSLLKQDFLLLLSDNLPVERQFAQSDTLVYQTRVDGKPAFQYLRPQDSVLVKTTLLTRGREQVTIEYDYRNPAFPDIALSHRHGKLNIFLFLLNEESPGPDGFSR